MAKKVIQAQMQQRRDTAANWAASNPVLLEGELGIVIDDPNLYKIGDGVTAWNDLKFRGFDGTLVQTTGDSENAVMSQKAVTEKLTELESKESQLVKEIAEAEQRVLGEVERVVDAVDNIKPIVINGDVTNAADEEDITSKGNLLKLKDRSALNGMGYVILRKNKTFASQVSKPNTIYEIRYDFDLGGISHTIPSGCSLKFVGGSLSNGKLIGNETTIVSDGNTIFNVGLSLEGFKEVRSSWLGMQPDTDNTEAFLWFSRFSLSIHFEKGVYRLTLSNLLLSEYTELVGCDKLGSTILSITPTSDCRYAIGINYNCGIRDIVISCPQFDGQVLRVSNEFRPYLDESLGSEYNFHIDNVVINGGWNEDGDYSNGLTALAILTNQYNDNGEVNVAKAISWHQQINRLRVKFAKIGILVQCKQDTTSSGYWSNSLLFTDLVINALYGIYFDRQNADSTGYCIISNYLFQSTNPSESFGLYGQVAKDKISSYNSWDNKYLGYVYGVLYADLTSLGLQSMIAEDSYCGFKVPDGKSLELNKTNMTNARFVTETFSPADGRGTMIDFAKDNEKTWYPNDFSTTPKVTDRLSGEGGFLHYSRLFSAQNKNHREYEEHIDNPSYRVRRLGKYHNLSSGDKGILDSVGQPTYSRYGVSKYVHNYNFVEVIKNLSFPDAPREAVYKVVFEVTNTEDGYIFVKNVFGAGCTILNSIVENKRVVVTIKCDDVYMAYVGVLMKFSATHTNDINDIFAGDISINITSEMLYKTVGSSEERPSLSTVDIGFVYFDKTLGKPLWWSYYNGWVDATGAQV